MIQGRCSGSHRDGSADVHATVPELDRSTFGCRCNVCGQRDRGLLDRAARHRERRGRLHIGSSHTDCVRRRCGGQELENSVVHSGDGVISRRSECMRQCGNTIDNGHGGADVSPAVLELNGAACRCRGDLRNQIRRLTDRCRPAGRHCRRGPGLRDDVDGGQRLTTRIQSRAA